MSVLLLVALLALGAPVAPAQDNDVLAVMVRGPDLVSALPLVSPRPLRHFQADYEVYAADQEFTVRVYYLEVPVDLRSDLPILRCAGMSMSRRAVVPIDEPPGDAAAWELQSYVDAAGWQLLFLIPEQLAEDCLFRTRLLARFREFRRQIDDQTVPSLPAVVSRSN